MSLYQCDFLSNNLFLNVRTVGIVSATCLPMLRSCKFKTSGFLMQSLRKAKSVNHERQRRESTNSFLHQRNLLTSTIRAKIHQYFTLPVWHYIGVPGFDSLQKLFEKTVFHGSCSNWVHNLCHSAQQTLKWKNFSAEHFQAYNTVLLDTFMELFFVLT